MKHVYIVVAGEWYDDDPKILHVGATLQPARECAQKHMERLSGDTAWAVAHAVPLLRWDWSEVHYVTITTHEVAD